VTPVTPAPLNLSLFGSKKAQAPLSSPRLLSNPFPMARFAVSLLLASALGSRIQEKELQSLGLEAAATDVDFEAAAAVSSCSMVSPEAAREDEGYRGMERLTEPGFQAPQGEADGQHVLFYAYGPMFRGYGQIGAWKYNEATQYIEFWYSKSHCMGMCTSCCDHGKGNTPGYMSKALNPSADQGTWGGYKLVNKFAPGAEIKFDSFGKFTLVNKILDHIYVCSKSNALPAWRA
ncbi:unnamed protein product, partial [Effrenium voratum]